MRQNAKADGISPYHSQSGVATYIPENQKTADLLKAQLPSVRNERFDTAAHALFIDDSEKFNRIVDDFVNGLK